MARKPRSKQAFKNELGVERLRRLFEETESMVKTLPSDSRNFALKIHLDDLLKRDARDHERLTAKDLNLISSVFEGAIALVELYSANRIRLPPIFKNLVIEFAVLAVQERDREFALRMRKLPRRPKRDGRAPKSLRRQLKVRG